MHRLRSSGCNRRSVTDPVVFVFAGGDRRRGRRLPRLRSMPSRGAAQPDCLRRRDVPRPLRQPLDQSRVSGPPLSVVQSE